MRKLLPLLLLVASAFTSRAQLVGFTIVVPPCNNNGILKASFSGVTPPLTVIWTTQGSLGMPITHTSVTSLTDALTGYSGGPLMAVARDTFGVSDTGYYGGDAPFSYNLSLTPGVCPALDTATDTVFGGTAPYVTQWYNMSTLATVATGSTVFLPPGDYGVMITDAAGCTYGSKVDPNYINLFSITSYNIVTAATTASCTNGTASVNVGAGSVAPLSYIWSNGATTASISGLVTGTYTVNVTDAQGCSNTGSIYVPQSITITAPILTTPATCLDTNGIVHGYGSGGTPPYTFLWNNGITTATQTGLAAGNYYVTVTDANGCIGSGSAVIASASPITTTYSATPSQCTTPDGNATVVATGGTFPYSIMWYTTPAQTSFTATGLIAGDYHFRVTDANGCVQDGSAVVQPIDVIALSFSSVAAVCTLANGSINVVPTGGIAPYHYLWSNGATTASITGVSTGDYNVTVTDHLGCSVTKSPYLSDYSPISVGVVSTPSSCIFASDGTNLATPFGGTAPYTYSWSSGGNTNIISGLPTGPYWVNVTDAAGCTSYENYSYVGYDATGTSCYCTIKGTVYDDANGNCIQDAGETGIPHIQMYISGRGYTYTDDSGNYSYEVPAGSYTISETVLAYYPLSACQANAIPIVVTTGSTACAQTVNFANSMDTVHDMHITTWDYYRQHPVPGQQYTQTTIITNDGSVTEPGPLASYTTDGQLYAPSFTPSGIFSGYPYTYNTISGFPILTPGGSQQFFMNYNVPTNIPLGTKLVFQDTIGYNAPIFTWVLDYSPWNNINYFTTTVAAAYDPNFKEVSPKGTGTAGIITTSDSVLEYMVHFQNTGTWPAENVVVKDTLSDNLDWTTMRPEYMSAACKVTLDQVGAKKVATFTFNNINLPTEASNPLGSNGMLTYTVHTKRGLAVGTQFTNRASIYFDYNAPIMTNSTLNTLGSIPVTSVSNVSPAAINTFAIYPNPAGSSFSAVINSDIAGNALMNISDVSGKLLISKTVAMQQGTQTITTDVDQLAPGLYFVTFNNHGKVQTQKLVIMK